MFRTYKYKDYFLTTDQVAEDPSFEYSFDVTPEEVVAIESGAAMEVTNEELIITE